MNPLLSVVIPTYHRNDQLATCLDYLRPGVQTIAGTQYEVIVSDDGRDTTAQQLITAQYPWVRWIKGPQRGPAANRNKGARGALGQWLVFTDDDCLPDTNWLLTYYQAIQYRPTITVFEGRTIADRLMNRYDEEAPVNETGGNLWSCNFCISKSTFFEFGGFDEQFPYAAMEDMDLATRLNKHKTSHSFLSDALIIHPVRLIAKSKYSQVYSSYVYFTMKHTHIGWAFRMGRLKFLVISLLKQGNRLIGYRFRGWQAYIAEHQFIIKTVFVSAK